MKILIVENEKPAADKMVRLLKKIEPSVTVTAIVETVESAVQFFQNEPAPDLILMDIQLDDGLCFEIFETINIEIPVIFTTAYDEYTLKAFKVNSVDYLLKPIEEATLAIAINKFKSLHNKNAINNDLLKRLSRELNMVYKSRFLVKVGANFKSIPVSEICCFYILERAAFIRTFADRDYAIDFSLDYLQKSIDPNQFFRINRNCIININAVSDIVGFSSSRLLIKLKGNRTIDDLIVSRDKVSEFKKWMDK
jgi:DNA-binding LytR/AlgR family response regulator